MSGTSDEFDGGGPDDVDEVEIINELAKKAAKGDREALKRLFEFRLFQRRFKKACRIIAKRRGVDPDEVEQEAYKRIWNKIDRFGSKSAFLTWASSIIHNISVDLVRIRERHERNDKAQEESVKDREYASGRGEDELVYKIDLEKAMSNLSPMEQQLVNLRFYLGCSPSEISQRLVLPVDQVYRLINNILKKLADML